MNQPMHDRHQLFAQLGLASEPAAIEAFIQGHRPLAREIPLAEAPFWTPAQAEFLREELLGDADWAELIDGLNADLRSEH